MKVGELRAKLAELPDDMDVMLEIVSESESDCLMAELAKADVESRCDEIDCLYLWGDAYA